MVQIRNMYSQGVSAALFTSSSQSLLIPDVKNDSFFTFTAENLGWQQEL
jgi:hypothetical protein